MCLGMSSFSVRRLQIINNFQFFNRLYSTVCIVIFSLVVAATIFENRLTAQGFDLSEDVKAEKSSSFKFKNGQNVIERCEMSNINNNNNIDNDCETRKNSHQSDLKGLGKSKLHRIQVYFETILLSRISRKNLALLCLRFERSCYFKCKNKFRGKILIITRENLVQRFLNHRTRSLVYMD